jgi:ribonucleoside-diphosphate reductase alpha chain
MKIDCVKNGNRIPIELRKNKKTAIKFLQYLIDNDITINNNDIYTLASWCNFDIKNFKKNESYSEIYSIKYIGNQSTSDLSIDDGHSFVSNGIICHNTVNLPNEVTEELVSKVYEMGWKSGCKGITVYRDGSRTGVLVSKKDKKADVFTENNAPKRPKILTCDVIRFTNKGEKWIGFLGLLDNRPYEIFTGLQEAVSIPNYVTTAEIIKERNAETDGQSRYDVRWVDKDGYTQEFRGLSRAFNREYWNIGRMVSAILRHGMPLPNVMTLLDKLDMGESEYISSWKNGVKRMIKKYIKDGTIIKGQECPNCHSHNLIYKEGCMSCADCGSSKCE